MQVYILTCKEYGHFGTCVMYVTHSTLMISKRLMGMLPTVYNILCEVRWDGAKYCGLLLRWFSIETRIIHVKFCTTRQNNFLL